MSTEEREALVALEALLRMTAIEFSTRKLDLNELRKRLNAMHMSTCALMDAVGGKAVRP